MKDSGLIALVTLSTTAIMATGEVGLLTLITGAVGVGALAVTLACAGIAYGVGAYYDKKASLSEEQEKFRNAYKEAYLKVSQENEQLKAQLAELQSF